MTRQVREVHLPQEFSTGYDKRLSVMLYQYLRELFTRPPGHWIEDEGTAIAQRSTLNFTGAGVAVTDVDGVTTVTIGGGAGASWTEAEVDFGSTPVYSASFTITDAAITSSAVKVQVLPCGKAATGRTADDWAWDGATFAANPGTGSATVYAMFLPGPIVGRRRVQYSVG